MTDLFEGLAPPASSPGEQKIIRDLIKANAAMKALLEEIVTWPLTQDCDFDSLLRRAREMIGLEEG